MQRFRTGAPKPRALTTGVLLAVLLALTPGSASAAWLNLRWSGCDASSPANLGFACDTDAGSHVLVASIRPTYSLGRLSGFWARLNVCFPNGPVPDWWKTVVPGTCRSGSMSVSFAAPGGDCPGYRSAVPGASGEVADYGWTQNPTGSNTGFITVVVNVDSSQAVPLVGGNEYFLFGLVLDHANTVGGDSCGGCHEPATITLAWTELSLIGENGVGVSGGSVVTWQGASASCSAVPARTRTWGSLKTRYR